jgi:hypothetical protein
MIFQYDEFADSLWVSLSEPSSPCVYAEGQTAGTILRVEESTGIVRSFEIIAWSRRIAKGDVLVPEVTDPGFQGQWIRNQSKMTEQRN